MNRLLQFRAIPVAYVLASFAVNFALFTSGSRQYVAFYYSAHQMTVACRDHRPRDDIPSTVLEIIEY